MLLKYQKLQLYGLYVVHICDFGIIRVKVLYRVSLEHALIISFSIPQSQWTFTNAFTIHLCQNLSQGILDSDYRVDSWKL